MVWRPLALSNAVTVTVLVPIGLCSVIVLVLLQTIEVCRGTKGVGPPLLRTPLLWLGYA